MNYWKRELSEIAFVPKVSVRAAEPAGRQRLRSSGNVVFAPRDRHWRSLALAARGLAGPTHRGPRRCGGLLHPPDQLPRTAITGTRRSTTSRRTTRRAVRARHGEPVQRGRRQVWAPRYRQAAFGAFLTTGPKRPQALDLAYADVRAGVRLVRGRARQPNADRPGRTQPGRAAPDRACCATRSPARRSPAASSPPMSIGWPISRRARSARARPARLRRAPTRRAASCAGRASPSPPTRRMMLETYDATTGLRRQAARGTPILCTNPLTGGIGGRCTRRPPTSARWCPTTI